MKSCNIHQQKTPTPTLTINPDPNLNLDYINLNLINVMPEKKSSRGY